MYEQAYGACFQMRAHVLLLTRAHLREYISEMYVHIVRTRHTCLNAWWPDAAECRPQPAISAVWCVSILFHYKESIFESVRTSYADSKRRMSHEMCIFLNNMYMSYYAQQESNAINTDASTCRAQHCTYMFATKSLLCLRTRVELRVLPVYYMRLKHAKARSLSSPYRGGLHFMAAPLEDGRSRGVH